MSLSGLLPVINADPELRRALDQAAELPALGGDLIAPPSLRPLLVAALAQPAGRHGQEIAIDQFVLAVTATARESEELAAALGSLIGPDRVGYFPAWETLPHERLSPRSDTSGQRLAVLRRLAHPDPADLRSGPLAVVTTPVRSLLQPMVSGLGELIPVKLAAGQEASLEDTVTHLVEIGYARVDMVERRGEIAVRGGLLDVFPPTEEHPLRVEFWGDEVEEIRYFKAADQRSLATAEDGLWAPPCRELLLTPAVRARARQLAAEWPGLQDILGKMAEGITVEGMEALAPALTDKMDLLLDYLPKGGKIIACDPERIRARAADLVWTSQEFLEASWVNAAAGGDVPIDLGEAAIRPIAEARAAAAVLELPWWTITPFAAADSASPTGNPADSSTAGAGADDGEEPIGEGDGAAFAISAEPAPNYRGDTSRAIADIRRWQSADMQVVLVTEGHGPARRLAELLRGEGLGARDGDLSEPPEAGLAHVATGLLESGFVWPAARLVVLAEADLAGTRTGTRQSHRMPSRRRGGIDPLQLTPGDFIVHEQHGVGRYLEMTSRTIQGATRDYLVIEYAPSKRGQPPDRLYLPTDQLDEVTRYTGGEAPTLHRLGGADWAKAKGRARKAVKDIAAGLIRLYQARMASPGHAFGADTPWQRELEDAFPYVETPDQLAAVDEVKADMERAVPMDRLICGDVGYGKTEIAVRAAFKAVQDGKQVAVLVPTTLLSAQHFATFSERYSPFPVTVRAMSRFQSTAEVADTLDGLASGKVDIVIGTHRLLSPEVRFARLGLLIVDEEQRFGVEHKEYLKQLRTEVDVLAMSATPIPRTLEMGISGIREMSTILTPPEERHPVLTSVTPYDERQIAAAIRRELLRDGQVFFVHNRVSSINKVAARLAELVPEARIGIGHGQMNEHTLEKVMSGFIEREFDVLVSTTIVESGLDIPNANTLIVDRADAYGLPDLHQLRGRVGRGRERGYAYFLYPPEKPLTETAHERLATLQQHTGIGAGLHIAMKDLEIRGAGNLLGGEQSGHIAAVGFDLYVKMIGEAVRELRGEGPAERAEVRVELPVDAHIPHDYVSGERLRLEAYTRIASINSVHDIDAVRDELADRYGPVPVQVENLLAVARLRAVARQAGLTDITLQGNYIRFAPVDLPESRQVRVQRLYPRTVLKPAVSNMLVPVPKAVPGSRASAGTGSGRSGPGRAGAGSTRSGTGQTVSLGAPPLRDTELLSWCEELIESVLAGLRPEVQASDGSAGDGSDAPR
ncbi:MAG TPA: transcription-repair coupling factor [Streptosporangiaceae bacterium]|nr:transcription-repair coupling factor [Streptosporangiaceae bacterium]